jgi:hypothetical protein
MRSLLRFGWFLGLVVLGLAGLTTLALAQQQPGLSGVVVDANGPVANAHVRVHLTDNLALTAADGTFTLPNVRSGQPVTLTAWSEGNYIAWSKVIPNGKPITLTLTAHYKTDNVDYNWFVQKFDHGTLSGSAACGVCHTAYKEWQSDAHAHSATNYRFLTLYAGTDVQGNKSPLPVVDPKTGVALPPDPKQPYFGPGFKLDNPNRTGICATCHTPMAAKIPTNSGCGWQGCHTSYTAQVSDLVPDGASPLGLKGNAAEGISCEFCHKIANVQINKDTGLPYEDSPGILSLMLLRPTAGHDLFFGPFDDVLRTDLPAPRDSYLPLQSESKFCAGCHYGVLGGIVQNMKVTGGVQVYSSFSEWLASPYSKGPQGQTCQQCHMPTGAQAYFAFPERGGQIRDPQGIHSHHMLGKSDTAFMQSAVSMTATAQLKAGAMVVNVTLVNDKAGHAVPTDSVLHHVLLVVTAKDATGKALPLRDGATLPKWAGNYADQPGKVFAKVLRDTWTNEVPTAAFWRSVEVVSDTRLMPLVADRTRFTFQAPPGAATVDVQLIYRRAPQQLMIWKGWTDQDLVLKQLSLVATK